MSIQKINNSNNYKQWGTVAYADSQGNYHSIDSEINVPVNTVEFDSNQNVTITATGTGTGAGNKRLLDGDWAISLTSAGWGNATLQTSVDGDNWVTADDIDGNAISAVTANAVYTVRGGRFYRLNVASYSQDIVFTAKKAKS